MRVTLQNIADKIGLSRSAISRALRDDPRMSVATRKKIHLLAQEMGYRPSAIMSEIASSRWQNAKATEASVIAYVDRTQRAGHRGAPVDFALSTQAQLLGYRLEIFRREEFGSSAKLQRLLRNRGITEIGASSFASSSSPDNSNCHCTMWSVIISMVWCWLGKRP